MVVGGIDAPVVRSSYTPNTDIIDEERTMDNAMSFFLFSVGKN